MLSLVRKGWAIFPKQGNPRGLYKGYICWVSAVSGAGPLEPDPLSWIELPGKKGATISNFSSTARGGYEVYTRPSRAGTPLEDT